MDQEEIIKERKEKLLRALKQDKLFSVFFTISVASFIFALSTRVGITFVIGFFSPLIWTLLAMLAGISAILAYYKKVNLSFIPLLGWIVFLAVRIRTRNLSGLRDVTTGTWTLGPDLDPFLFLRWTKHIVANGSLFDIDPFRYSPLGLSVGEEYLLLPNLMSWFHKFAVYFGSESVTHSAVLFPAFMFSITVIAFFFMTRKMFVDFSGKTSANVIALVSSFFLSIMPALLPRTIAGIPEKESAAFFFLFMAFYLFISAWKSKHPQGKYVLAVLAGIFTAGMAHIWGGYIFIFLTIALAVFVLFVFNQVKKKETYVYLAWLATSLILMNLFSERYIISELVRATSTGAAIALGGIIILDIFLFRKFLKNKIYKNKMLVVPERVFSIIVSVILLGILGSVLFGPSIILNQLIQVKDALIKPATSRLIQTVAENRQPFFTEWANSFGPRFRNIALTFWLFFIGSIFLFNSLLKKCFEKKERIYLTVAYVFLITAVIFSRYSSGSTFNGENIQSVTLYALGFIVFVVSVGYFLYNYHKSGKIKNLENLDFGIVLLFGFFFLGIVAARAAVRTIMVLVPPASIIVAFFAVYVFLSGRKIKDNTLKMIMLFVAVIVIIATVFSGVQYYTAVNSTASAYVPSVYNQQWQRAMSWVRDNTDKDAVFGHWWDYGYWIQGIGERTTVLDGGNNKGYWNHMMGRYALTGDDPQKALEFLYAHETTHFLIDSTDIGKYTAYATIGSDITLDRRSWISTFQRDNSRVFENKNATAFVYIGGFALDEDVTWKSVDGSEIFLPGAIREDGSSSGEVAGLGAITIEIANGNTLLPPKGLFVFRGQQYEIPLRYAYFNDELIDFGDGIEAGVFLMPRVSQTGQGVQIEENGALFYLSRRTVKSQLARLYLYGEEDNFKLAHQEDDFIIANLKQQGADVGDFVLFNGFRGPIKIWEIDYPDDIEYKEEYIEETFPEEGLYYA